MAAVTVVPPYVYNNLVIENKYFPVDPQAWPNFKKNTKNKQRKRHEAQISKHQNYQICL